MPHSENSPQPANQIVLSHLCAAFWECGDSSPLSRRHHDAALQKFTTASKSNCPKSAFARHFWSAVPWHRFLKRHHDAALQNFTTASKSNHPKSVFARHFRSAVPWHRFLKRHHDAALQKLNWLINFHAINFETIDNLHKRMRRIFSKPTRRTPRILKRILYQTMFDWVLIDITQPG